MKCNIISVLFTSFLVVSCAVRLTDNKKTVLKNELAEMVKIDQVAAGMPQGVYKEYTKEQWNCTSATGNERRAIARRFLIVAVGGFCR